MAVRNQYIDALRVLAAFGVVWFHAKAPGSQIALSGLYFFVIISFFFAAKSSRKLSVGDLVLKLLAPWAVFYAFYLAADMVRGKYPFSENADLVSAILYGPSPHLWFLPFLFGAMILFDLTLRKLPKPALYTISTIGLGAIAAALPFFWSLCISLGEPYAQWLAAVPAIFMGISIATRKDVKWGNAGLVMIAAILTLNALSSPVASIAQTYLIAYLATWAALVIRPIDIGVNDTSRTMMFVYLMHPAAIWVLKPALGDMPAFMAIVTFLLCAILPVMVISFATREPRKSLPNSRNLHY